MKEIVTINSRPFEERPITNNTTIIEQKASTADELAKLKKLMDDGVITTEEFEAQQKKLLGE
ncbi:MAG TPA: SHOCT domain-containing protein [Chitinophagaceae bacterium]|nr:SHOCT domain-containing protein [Chitinophagaceae bacterium]